jgi:hypothetical protein
MKRSEYEPLAKEFRAELERISHLPEPRPWPEHDEWLQIAGIATCTTPNCVAFGVGFPVLLHENGDGVYRGQCGVCDQPNTPVPVFDEEDAKP